MNIENINTPELQNAINSCLNYINQNMKLENIITNITNENVWSSQSQKTLKIALNSLKNNRYLALKQQLEEYLNICNSILKYQSLASANADFSSQYRNLSKKLYVEEKYIEEVPDRNGIKIKIERTRKVKDYNIQRNLNTIQRKISDNQTEMDKLKRIIESI